VIHEQPAIAGSVAFGAHLPQPRRQWTDLSQALQSLHILITDPALRPSSHAGHHNAPQLGAQLASACLDCSASPAQISCRTGLPGGPQRTSSDGVRAAPRGAAGRSPSLTRLGFLTERTSGDGVRAAPRGAAGMSPSLTRLGFLTERTSGDGARAAPRSPSSCLRAVQVVTPHRKRMERRVSRGTTLRLSGSMPCDRR
jgi:hypothetical protein